GAGCATRRRRSRRSPRPSSSTPRTASARSESRSWSGCARIATSGSCARPDRLSSPMASPTILIVDDDQFARLYLKDALASLDARVIEAADGVQCLATVAKEKPALVLLDLLMPNKSGLEALPEILKASPKTRVVVEI